MTPLILESRRADYISFQTTFSHLRKTDRRTNNASLTLQLESTQDKQKDKLQFISFLILDSTQDRQTDKLRFISSFILESTQDK